MARTSTTVSLTRNPTCQQGAVHATPDSGTWSWPADSPVVHVSTGAHPSPGQQRLYGAHATKKTHKVKGTYYTDFAAALFAAALDGVAWRLRRRSPRRPRPAAMAGTALSTAPTSTVAAAAARRLKRRPRRFGGGDRDLDRNRGGFVGGDWDRGRDRGAFEGGYRSDGDRGGLAVATRTGTVRAAVARRNANGSHAPRPMVLVDAPLAADDTAWGLCRARCSAQGAARRLRLAPDRPRRRRRLLCPPPPSSLTR